MDSGIVKFYDKEYHLLGVDDDATIIYTESWNTYGDFEIYLKEKHIRVEEGNRIVLDQDGRKNGIIKYISQEDDVVKIRGYSLLWLLGQRITVPKTGNAYASYKGSIEDVLYGLVKDNAVNAEDPKRNFKHLECAPSQGRGAYFKYQTRYDNLLDCLNEISNMSMAGISIRVIPEEAREIFEVNFGTDRSIEQDLNPQVVFKKSLDNILKETYTLNSENHRNMAYVGGQGEGVERAIVKIGDDSIGEDRKEIFVDARDIENIDELEDRGLTKLAGCKVEESFEVVADSFDYKKRWNLGDKVTVYGEDVGVYLSDYVTQVIETTDEKGTSFIPIFGIEQRGVSGGGTGTGTSGKIENINPYDASITIADGTDLDYIVDPGIYTLWGTAYVHPPQASFYGILQVFKYHGSYRIQIAVRASASLTAEKKVYIRHKINSGWSEWTTII